LYYYGARYYEPEVGKFYGIDPMTEKYPSNGGMVYCVGNPLNVIDPTGMDWVEGDGGTISWNDDVTSQETAKEGQKWLGKNVLVGTHNREANLNEPVNSARFDLYLESNKEGPTATIDGNTVPADVDKYGTLAEGLYPAKGAIYHGNNALLINGGGDLPTVNGNPNNKRNYEGNDKNNPMKPIEQHIMNEVFFHRGNVGVASLTYDKGRKVITAGCQTGPHGPNTKELYKGFAKNFSGFGGNYYLRGNNTRSTQKSYVPFVDGLQGVINPFKR
jgi:hypothetical protein